MSLNLTEAKMIIEAAILSAGEPVSLQALQKLFANELDAEVIRKILIQLQEDCGERGIELQEVASGFRFRVKSELLPHLQILSEEKPAKYSAAILETLAIIVYRQPITRGEIEAIRGVAVSTNTIKTLTDRNWIKVAGHRDTPGKPELFVTTKQFLDDFNLKNLAELPSLSKLTEVLESNEQLEIPC